MNPLYPETKQGRMLAESFSISNEQPTIESESLKFPM
jgi:hypothetical protein